MLLSALLLALAGCAHRNGLFALGSSMSSDAFVVDTGYARYLGNHSYPNTVAYLGIPYAEPPVGDRRFRAPLPLNTDRMTAETKGAVIDATEYPDFCVQGTTGSEFRFYRTSYLFTLKSYRWRCGRSWKRRLFESEYLCTC